MTDMHPDREDVTSLISCEKGLALLGTAADHDAAMRAAATIMHGLDDDATRARVAQVVLEAYADGCHGLPPLFDELLTSMGLDPDGVLALSLSTVDHTFAIESSHARMINIGMHMADATWIVIGPGMTWREDKILLSGVPDTLTTAAVGRPLRDLLTHPVLDRFDLQIRATWPLWEDATMTEIVTCRHEAYRNGE